MITIPTLTFIVIALFWAAEISAVKTSDVKDKRGASSGSYGSALSPPYSPPDHSIANSGFTPITPPVGVYPQTPAAISALLIPGNLLYGQGLDYSGLSYGGYGGYNGYPSVPTAYPLGLNLAPVASPSVAAYKLGPVTFNPSPAVTPYAAPAYPSYNILSSLSPDYSGYGSAYSLPPASSYPSPSIGYSPSYSSGSSNYASSSYPSSSLSSYSSPSSQSSSTYSSSPPYSAFVANSHRDTPYSSYSSPSSYGSSSGYSSPGYSSQSSYSSPSNSYSHSSSSSYPSSVYGAPSYKPGSSLYSKY